MDFVIRRAVEDDADQAAQFGALSFTDTFGYLYPPHDLEKYLSESYTEDIFKNWVNDPKFDLWIAEVVPEVDTKRKIIGYCLGGPCGLPHSDATEANGELKKLYIDIPYFGKGVAKALFDESIKFLKESPLYKGRPIYIGVWSENYRAQKFYEKMGYEVVGEYLYEVGESRDREFIMCEKKTVN